LGLTTSPTAGIGWQYVTASLPISVSPISQGRQDFIGLSDRYGALVSPSPTVEVPVPSAVLRKAAYAERDRARSMDPGALDFEAGDDDEVSDSDDGTEAGNRGRRYALKILQARSELPSEGMWRSLAT